MTDGTGGEDKANSEGTGRDGGDERGRRPSVDQNTFET